MNKGSRHILGMRRKHTVGRWLHRSQQQDRIGGWLQGEYLHPSPFVRYSR